MSTIYISMDTDEFLDNVPDYEQESSLLDVLEKFNPNHINAALREYFGLQTRDESPDFVDAEKL